MKVDCIDIIIPVYKPDQKFGRLLRAISRQTVLPDKIIILNTLSEGHEPDDFKDAFRSLLKQDVVIDIFDLSPEEFDHGRTRDEGIRTSYADVVIMMTQDAVPDDDMLIEELITRFEKDDQVGVVYARQLPDRDCNVIESYTRNFNYPAWDMEKSKADLLKMGIKAFFCSDVCAAYRRDVYLDLGGFEYPCIFNEDMIMARRIIDSGMKVYYASRARVIHSHNYSNKEQFKRNFDLGVSQKDHPDVFGNISSESEGSQMVLATVKYLFKTGKPHLIFKLGTSCASKYAGYFLGKHYDRLKPEKIIKYTSNPHYWDGFDWDRIRK